MKIGDNIVLKSKINIGSFKRHGIIIGVHSSWQFPVEILFADDVNESYSRHDFIIISDQEYFKLQLS